MNLHEKLREAETFFNQGYYAQAVNTCGQVLEALLRQLYQSLISSLPPDEAQKVLETLQAIGKGKKPDELTLGQLDNLFRQADLPKKLERSLGRRIQGLENVRVYIDLRNQATHGGAEIERESAEAFLSYTRWLVKQALPPEKPQVREVSALPAWRQIATPHRDIREGRFDEAVYAAKLDEVLSKSGPVEYRDPETFFRLTYPTTGLGRLVQTVCQRLAGGAGEGVIQLQTPFGGGKSHALIMLYHLFKHRERVMPLESVQQLLGGLKPADLPLAKVAAFVGTGADVQKGRTPWGEIAEQLGDYELLKEHDRGRVAPGKAVLRKLLERHAPVLILIDELLEYVVKAAAVKVEEGTLKGQVLAFLQELTEVVSSLPQASLVLTLPSSLLERYDESAEEALAQLQRISGRVEAIYTPVEGMEIYEIIRRRLFEDPGDPAEHSLVADEYFQFYQSLGEDIPSMAREPGYRERLRHAYPFHPELIDILFEQWSTFASFQRTRGVLRLLARVVGDLFEQEHQAPLIQPAHLNLSNRHIRNEFLNHIGLNFEGVVASDIADHSAKVQQLDRDMGAEYRRYQVASSLATAIFFYSFSGGGARPGVGIPRLRLAFLRPGIPPAIVGDMMSRLENELWYLHREEGRYYFSAEPNLNRVLLDRMSNLREEDVLEEIHRQVKGAAGEAINALLFPARSGDIPDDKKLKLAVFSEEYPAYEQRTEEILKEFFERCGEGYRANKNTLLFLLPDGEEVGNLQQETRRLLALRGIKRDEALVEKLSRADRKDLDERLKKAESDLPFRVLQTWRILARGSSQGRQFHDIGRPMTGEKYLSQRVRTFLESEGTLLRQLSPRYVGELLGERKELDYQTIANSFYTSPGKPFLENEDVLKGAIVEGVRQRFFGLKVGEQIFFGESVAPILIDSEAKIVCKEIAEASKKEPEERKAGEAYSPPEVGKPGAIREREEERGGISPISGQEIKITARLPWDKLSDFVNGVILPLQSSGAKVNLKVELTAQSQEPIGHNILELKVRETLRQIGADFRLEEI